MRIILLRTYELLKLHIILHIFHVLISLYLYQTKHSLINSSLYPLNFGNVSGITVKIRQFQNFSLMHSFIVSV